MKTLNARIQAVFLQIDPEFRSPVVRAANLSDGTFISFQQELAAQTWDYPALPVQDILDKIAYDLA